MADYEVSRFEHAITTRIHNKLKDVDSWADFVDDDNTLAVALHSLSEGYEVTHVRAHGDKRHDAVVKREILERDLLPEYYILGAIDDRLRVLSMWQASGIFTFNVNQTGADF